MAGNTIQLEDGSTATVNTDGSFTLEDGKTYTLNTDGSFTETGTGEIIPVSSGSPKTNALGLTASDMDSIQLGLGAAANTYGAAINFQSGDYNQAAAQGALGATQGAALLGNETAAEILPYVNYVNAAVGIYEGIKQDNTEGYLDATQAAAGLAGPEYAVVVDAGRNIHGIYGGGNDLMTDGEKAERTQQEIGRVVASYYTAGLSEFAVYALRKYAPELDSALTKFGAKTNPISVGINAVGSKKDEYQIRRDMTRDFLVENKILDDKYQGTLADGSTYDFGADDERVKNIDYNDAHTGDTISFANTIAIAEGQQGKSIDASAMLYTDALKSNSNGNLNVVRENAEHFATQRGLTAEILQERFDTAYTTGKISYDEYKVSVGRANEFSFVGGKLVTLDELPDGNDNADEDEDNED